MTTDPSQSAEDYLERILELIQETGQARVVDIANSLNIRQASVTNMVKKLCELGFVDHEKYKRGLVLTETGRRSRNGSSDGTRRCPGSFHCWSWTMTSSGRTSRESSIISAVRRCRH